MPMPIGNCLEIEPGVSTRERSTLVEDFPNFPENLLGDIGLLNEFPLTRSRRLRLKLRLEMTACNDGF